MDELSSQLKKKYYPGAYIAELEANLEKTRATICTEAHKRAWAEHDLEKARAVITAFCRRGCYDPSECGVCLLQKWRKDGE